MLIEKLMSGLYMGDCARRILLSFAQRADLFYGDVPIRLTEGRLPDSWWVLHHGATAHSCLLAASNL